MSQFRASNRRVMPRPENIPKRPHHISQSLHDWAYGRTHSIWLRSTTDNAVVGMTDAFRDVMRPIFRRVFDDLHVNGRIPPPLGTSIRVAHNSSRVKGDSTDNATVSQMCTVIKDLRDIVYYVVEAEFPDGDKNLVPRVVRRFYYLCNFVVSSQRTVEAMKDLAYFVCKNPIIFTDTECMAFIDKCWNLWKMDPRQFERNIRMLAYKNFITLIDPTMKALYNVKMYAPVNQRAYNYNSGPSSVRYIGNVRSHYQDHVPKRSCLDIFDHIASVLYDFIPICFHEIVESYWGNQLFYLTGRW